MTAKQVAIRSKRPWYFQWVVTGLLVLSGYAVAYWQFASGGENLHENLRQTSLENQALNTKIIRVERQLQIEQAAQENLSKELNRVQDENMHLKEDLVFYKKMTNGRNR